MTSGSYWDSLTRNRLSRRRALATASGLASGLALLAACGGGDEEQSTRDASGLLTAPLDTTNSGRSGGVYKDFATQDILHHDALVSNSTQVLNTSSIFVYPNLLKFAVAKYPKVPDGSSEGEAVESFELSADKLQLTLRLRKNVKWDSRAPTNGRLLDAQDIVFSWTKYAASNPSAADIVYNAARRQLGPVESISALDNSTVVMKLHEPDSSLIPLLSSGIHFKVMPRESDGGFDPKTVVRGAGPWIVEEFQPSVGVTFRKNPDYYVANRPFPDKLERPLITDYSQRLAQFRAGTIYPSVVSPEDVVRTKRDVPQASLMQADAFVTSVGPYMSFGYEGNSPFKDARMRRAIGMVLDGDSYSVAIDNLDGFRREGLSVEVGYNTIVSPAWPGFYISPNDEKDFGQNAKYLKFDVAEAKKLTAAAGYASGAAFDFIYNRETNYAVAYHKTAEIYTAMLIEAGFKPSVKPLAYRDFYDNYFQGYLSQSFIDGKVKGLNGVMLRTGRGFPTVASQFFGTMHRNGSVFHGATLDGANAHLGDSKLNEMIEKIKLETDLKRQQSLVHEVIRYYAGQAYSIQRPIQIKAFTVSWPVISNQGVYRRSPGGNQWAESRIHEWIDPSKPPLGRA